MFGLPDRLYCNSKSEKTHINEKLKKSRAGERESSNALQTEKKRYAMSRKNKIIFTEKRNCIFEVYDIRNVYLTPLYDTGGSDMMSQSHKWFVNDSTVLSN